MKCPSCGASYAPDSKRCAYCGNYFDTHPTTPTEPKVQYVYVDRTQNAPQSKWVALFLCLFTGTLGLHRFYVGKIATGLFYLFSWGGFGIGLVSDLIRIVSGNFTNKQGRPLRK